MITWHAATAGGSLCALSASIRRHSIEGSRPRCFVAAWAFSISLGVPPVEAIQMAFLNTAQHFRMADRFGSLTPGRWADVILSESLDEIIPVDVFVRGEHVASQGKLTQAIPEIEYPE